VDQTAEHQRRAYAGQDESILLTAWREKVLGGNVFIVELSGRGEGGVETLRSVEPIIGSADAPPPAKPVDRIVMHQFVAEHGAGL